MLAIRVGGMPTRLTTVSTLMPLFCSMLRKPSVASSRNCTLPVSWASWSASEAMSARTEAQRACRSVGIYGACASAT